MADPGGGTEAAAERDFRADETTVDAFLGGALLLRQLRKGHRAGTDAVLLAAAAPPDFSDAALDVGAGGGAVGLAFALRRPGARIGLVENDRSAAALARENIALNGLADRGAVFEADILSPARRRDAGLRDAGAALVMTNPPFLDPGKARLSPQPGRRSAHAMADAGPAPLGAWIAACLALAEAGGSLILIHRPDALAAILAGLAGKAGAVRILPVHPRRGEDAVRILVRAEKGSRAPLALAPPLVLHEGAAFTDRAQAIHLGEAIDWRGD
jgi:tRNA1(Val) A37 N6-methylase TrmN6